MVADPKDRGFLRVARARENRPWRSIAFNRFCVGLTSNFSSKSLGAKLFPFVATLFLYVLVSNWMSVLPGLEAPTTDPNVTLGLALMVLVMSHVFLIRTKGLRGYKKELFTPAWLAPVNIMTEVIASRKDERQRPAPDLGFELE